jgi:hypothetical protein
LKGFFQKLPVFWGCALEKCLQPCPKAEKLQRVLVLRSAKLLTCPLCSCLGPALVTVIPFRIGAGMHLDVCWLGSGNVMMCLFKNISITYFAFMLLFLSS